MNTFFINNLTSAICVFIALFAIFFDVLSACKAHHLSIYPDKCTDKSTHAMEHRANLVVLKLWYGRVNRYLNGIVII